MGGGGGRKRKSSLILPGALLRAGPVKTTAEAFDGSPVQVGASLMVIKVLVH